MVCWVSSCIISQDCVRQRPHRGTAREGEVKKRRGVCRYGTASDCLSLRDRQKDRQTETGGRGNPARQPNSQIARDKVRD